MENTLPTAISILDRAMSAAGWHSNHNRLFEAVPHMSDRLTSEDMIKTLQNLGVPLSTGHCTLQQITNRDCPALFVRENGDVLAIFEVNDTQLLCCTMDEAKPIWQDATNVSGLLVRLERFNSGQDMDQPQSFSQICSQFTGLMPWLIFASFMSNLAGLATPLLIMVIYDRVIPSGSVELVMSLVLAVLLAVAADCGFRFARTSAVAHMGRCTEHRMGLALFRKLLALPIDQIQKSDVEQQLARFRQFESLRDVFSGQTMTTLLDLPFIVIFLAVLFVLNPTVAWLVICLAAVFALAICLNLPKQKTLNAEAAEQKTRLHSHVYEATEKQKSIQRLGLTEHWKTQNALLAKQAAQSARRVSNFNLISQSFGQSLMAIAGIGAVAISARAAIHGEMSFGALIAVMALVWKVLTPLQALYTNAPQILGFLQSKRQSDRVLSLPEEVVRGIGQSHQKAFKGQISLNGVTHRYDAATAAVLSQVSLDIQAGECVILSGESNSGRATMFDLICGFRQPSLGSIQLDGVDVRQIAVDDLRRTVTYEPSRSQLFYGTIYQNFRLASPSISEQDVKDALATVGLMEEVSTFEDGIHTRLSEAFRKTLSQTTLRALTLARSLVREGSVLLLHEPVASLDRDRKDAFVQKIAKLRGTRTIVIATSDADLMKAGDRFIYLDQGRIVANDTGAAGLKKMMALKNNTGGQ